MDFLKNMDARSASQTVVAGADKINDNFYGGEAGDIKTVGDAADMVHDKVLKLGGAEKQDGQAAAEGGASGEQQPEAKEEKKDDGGFLGGAGNLIGGFLGGSK